MEQAPDPNSIMAYVMLAVYNLLMLYYWLAPRDDPDADDQAAKTDNAKLAGDVLGTHYGWAGLGLGARLLNGRAGGAGRSASGFDEEDREAFLSGARRAHEVVIGAYAAGDLDALEDLVAPDVLEAFRQAVNERQARSERASISIIGLKTAEITSVDADVDPVQVNVRFVTEQVTVLHDPGGAVLAGNPNEIVEVVDLWRFARDRSSDDPNWTLVATDHE